MLIFYKGICYLHLNGKLWIDWNSWTSYDNWINKGKDYSAIIWQQGYCPMRNYRPFSKAGI